MEKYFIILEVPEATNKKYDKVSHIENKVLVGTNHHKQSKDKQESEERIFGTYN